MNHIQINLENVKGGQIEPITLINRRMILRNGKKVGEPPKFREDIHTVCLDLKVNLRLVENLMESVEEYKTILTDKIYLNYCKGLKEHYDFHTGFYKHLRDKCVCPCEDCLEEVYGIISEEPYMNTIVSSEYPLLADIALSREHLKHNMKTLLNYVLAHGGDIEGADSARVYCIKKKGQYWNGNRMCSEVDVKVMYWDILSTISEEEGNFRAYKDNNNDWYSQFE